ncbi:unnamed protein product [Arabidopsis halleri]
MPNAEPFPKPLDLLNSKPFLLHNQFMQLLLMNLNFTILLHLDKCTLSLCPRDMTSSNANISSQVALPIPCSSKDMEDSCT